MHYVMAISSDEQCTRLHHPLVLKSLSPVFHFSGVYSEIIHTASAVRQYGSCELSLPPVSITEITTKFFFPKNTSFYKTTCLNCVERASYDCGEITGKTNRASLSPPCTQSPEAHKTSLSKLTQCDSKFYIQIS